MKIRLKHISMIDLMAAECSSWDETGSEKVNILEVAVMLKKKNKNK